MLETIVPRWTGTAIVAATGPSLTEEVAEICNGYNVVAVNDAYKLIPFAPVLYACDAAWWRHHKTCPGFTGEKWSTHDDRGNKKIDVAEAYGVHLVQGRKGGGFSTNPAFIHYGSNSGFQATNLAILFGATRIVLVGFDMRSVGGRQHFFGTHPTPLRQASSYSVFVRAFNEASHNMPPGVQIINATPDSALKCFPFVPLQEALYGLDRGTPSRAPEIRPDLQIA